MTSTPSDRVHVLNSGSMLSYSFTPAESLSNSVFDGPRPSSSIECPFLRSNLIRLYFMVTETSRAFTPSGRSIVTSTSSSLWLHDTWGGGGWRLWNGEGWPLGSASARICDSWMRKFPTEHQVYPRSGRTGSTLARESCDAPGRLSPLRSFRSFAYHIFP